MVEFLTHFRYNDFENKKNFKGDFMLIWELFFTFFKIGAFTYGGGYAMIPLIEREIITNKGWIDEEELLEIITIAQMTPGVIAINTATFVGRKTAGVKGAIIASCAIALPSLFAITIVVKFLSGTFDTVIAKKILTGVRGGLLALMARSLLRLYKSGADNIISSTILIITLTALILAIISPIKLIIAGAIFGLALYGFFPKFALKFMESGKK
jgi:chromate transporter